MIISFSGTQSGMTHFQSEELKKILNLKQCSEFAHGDCVGSDIEAAYIAVDMGINIFTVFPPDRFRRRAFFADEKQITKHNGFLTPYIDVVVRGKNIKVRWMPVEPYLKRNVKMVDYSAMLIATPKEFKHTIRSGTWATIRHAWKSKKDEVVIPPIERPEENAFA